MAVIDAWAQCPNETFMGQPWLESLNRWTGRDGRGQGIAPELMLAAMDAADVQTAMLCAWTGPQGPLITNDEVAALVDAHPDRFVGVAAVDLSDPWGAIATLKHYVTERGFKAIRVVPWLWGLPPNDRHYYPLYVTCIELGIPFLTQIGHTGPLKSSEPGRPIPYLEDVLLDFPDLTVVGGHVGQPWIQEVLSLAHKFPNFHIDTSAYVVGRPARQSSSTSCAAAVAPGSCSGPTFPC